MEMSIEILIASNCLPVPSSYLKRFDILMGAFGVQVIFAYQLYYFLSLIFWVRSLL